MQKDRQEKQQHEQELSETWQELLGYKKAQEQALSAVDAQLPTLKSDPWSELVHKQGNEEIDLQAIHWSISDQDVEQVLEVMQEQPENDPEHRQRRPSK